MKRFRVIIILLLTLAFGACHAEAEARPAQQKTSQTAKKKKSSPKKSAKGSTRQNKNRQGGTTAKSRKPRTASEVEQARQKNAKELRETERKIKLNTKETEQRLNQLNLLEGEINDCNTHIGRLRHSLDSINTSIGLATDSIAALDSRLDAITRKYIASVRKTQGRRQHMSDLAFIFSSESFSQAYRRMRSLRQFSKWRKRRSQEISEMRSELDTRRSHLSALRGRASDHMTRLGAEKDALVKKQSETTRLVGRLKNEGSELRQIMSRRQREAESLDAELDRIIAEEAARQERLRREKEEAERKARLEAERKAREAEEARKAEEAAAEQERLAQEEARATREAEQRAEAARKAEQEARAKAEEAERKARATADKEARELAKKQREEAQKAEQARIKAEKDAEKKARKQAENEKRRKVKPVKHKGKNNRREDADGRATSATETPSATAANAPTLKAPASAGESGIAHATAAPAGGDFEAWKGRIPFPVTGRYTIVKRFGRQKHPTLPHVETTNSGIDMQTEPGATVRCVFDGEVSAVFRTDGYNNVVVVKHGKYITVYANIGKIDVSTGQKIKAGAPIGTVYTDPNDGNRSILHFEVRHQRQKENPEAWLKR